MADTMDPVRQAYTDMQHRRRRLAAYGWSRGPLAALQDAQSGTTEPTPVDNGHPDAITSAEIGPVQYATNTDMD